jgi:hypothetical protein
VLALKEIALMQGGLPKLSEEIWARYSDPKMTKGEKNE